MRNYIWAAVFILLPSICYAATDCHTVEYPDHFEAICTGDEKAVIPPSPSPAPAPQAAWPTAKKRTAEASADAPTKQVIPNSAPPAGSPAMTHRQGRSYQVNQADMQSAIAARRSLILEHLQNNK